MLACESAFGAVAPWLASLDELEHWLASTLTDGKVDAGRGGVALTLDSLRSLLRSLQRGEVGIPAELPAGVMAPRPTLEGWLQAAPNATGLGQLRERRLSVLRLAVWRALKAWVHSASQAAGGAPPSMGELMVWMGRLEARVPPGLGPTLRYAAGESAHALFNDLLRNALLRLAENHDSRGAQFAALARQPAFDGTGVAVEHWSRAWTAAVAAVYLDWLTERGDTDVMRAMRFLWQPGEDKVRFRPPDGLAVLPTRQRDIHMDLWLDVVLAQALAHSNSRWLALADGQLWHRVTVDMHDMADSARGSRSQQPARKVFRGLCVKMLYQAVFAARLHEELALRDREPPAVRQRLAGSLKDPVTFQVELPLSSAGQRANLEFVIRCLETPIRDGTRLSQRPADLDLDAQQLAVLAAWRSRRPASCPSSPSGLAPGWRSATPDEPFLGAAGQALPALGHAALWQAVGEGVHWLELSLAIRLGGHWREVQPCMVDEAMEGVVHSWLVLDETTDPALLQQADALRCALRSPVQSCWAIWRAGLGAFVTVGVDLDAGMRSGDTPPEGAVGGHL